jgi:O-antigen ligase
LARGAVHIIHGLLILWGLAWLLYGRHRWPAKVSPIPRHWLHGYLVFALACAITSIFSDKPLRGVSFFLVNTYVILSLPLAWLALSQWPRLVRHLPYLYGAGLIATGLVTYYQVGCRIYCKRAPSYLGIIDLAGVLIELAPLVVGALAMGMTLPGRKRVLNCLFFIVAMVATYVAMRNNCSRITFICLPLLSMIMFAVNYKYFKNLFGIFIIIITITGFFYIVQDNSIRKRFSDIVTGKTNNNTERFNYWEHGFEAFKKHPVLGIGPDSLPNLPPEKNISRRRGVYSHAHHVFLTVMAEMGLVGLAGFLFFITRPIKSLWPQRRSKDRLTYFWAWAGFLVMADFFINGLTDNIFGNKMIMITHFSIMGIAMWVTHGRLPDKSPGINLPAS